MDFIIWNSRGTCLSTWVSSWLEYSIYQRGQLLVILLVVVGCNPEPNETVDTEPVPEAISVAGAPLYPIELSSETIEKQKPLWEKAYLNYQLDQTNIDNIIWYGRRTAYLQEFKEAIEIFSNGLEQYPDSARLLRHRGHRYITIRKFDLAIKDLSKAAELVQGTLPRIEADGIPNKLNIPLGNTQFNIYYHLGLAYYLEAEFEDAVASYKHCLEYSNNDDLLVATLDWMYMSLLRLDQKKQADKFLEQIHEDMNIIENNAYHQRLLMYKGLRSPESLLQVSGDIEDRSLVIATQGYGVGNWYLNQGKQDQGLKIFQLVTETGNWPAFGYIAAEVDLFRLNLK